MDKADTDGRREPPQTVTIILTALPLACAALAYAWLRTPLPQRLAHLPWREMLQALPWFPAIAACAPLGYLAAHAYLALSHWRLDAGETFRAWLVATVGTTFCVAVAVMCTASLSKPQPLPVRLVSAAALVTTMLLPVFWIGDDSHWPQRLLFPRHERLRKRLAPTVDDDMGERRWNVNIFWFNYDGLRLPNPLDVYPEWFRRNRVDLEAYAAYHPDLKEDLNICRERMETRHDTD